MKEKFTSPVYNVRPIPIEKIQANAYNPNSVAPPEMKLLYKSILEDGYTMPIVCYHIPETDTYEIVDGYHRYLTMKQHKDIYDREGGCLPGSGVIPSQHIKITRRFAVYAIRLLYFLRHFLRNVSIGNYRHPRFCHPHHLLQSMHARNLYL